MKTPLAAYTLRGMDPTFWRKVKVKAAEQHKPIRTVLLELLQRWLDT